MCTVAPHPWNQSRIGCSCLFIAPLLVLRLSNIQQQFLVVVLMLYPLSSRCTLDFGWRVVVPFQDRRAVQPTYQSRTYNISEHDILRALGLLASTCLLAGVSGTDCILHSVCYLLLSSELASRVKHAQCFPIQNVGKDTLEGSPAPPPPPSPGDISIWIFDAGQGCMWNHSGHSQCSTP